MSRGITFIIMRASFDLLNFFEYDIIFLVTYSIIVIHLIVTVQGLQFPGGSWYGIIGVTGTIPLQEL